MAYNKRPSTQPKGPANQSELMILTGLETTGKEIGKGSYGTVFELRDMKSKTQRFAAKQLRVQDVKFQYQTRDKFVKEYQETYAKLRHPNIVGFCGFCLLSTQSSTIPLLVMEKVTETVTSFLDRSTNIQMADELTILLGVAEGLSYLHSKRIPVVHGRLSSNKILLKQQENELQVKIGGVGIAALMKYHKPSVVNHHGSVRSTTDFLPPNDQPYKQNRLIPSLDIFSYGAITMHTVTQEWPTPQQQQSLCAKIKSERIEFEMLVKSCMDVNHQQRPPIATVLETIKKLYDDQGISKPDQKLNPGSQPEVSDNKIDSEEKEMASKLEEMASKLKEMTSKLEELANENERLKQAIKEKDDKLLTVVHEKDEEIRLRNKDVAKRNMELRQKDQLIHEKDVALLQKDLELKQKDKKIEELTRQLLSFLPVAHMCTVENFPSQVYVNKEASMVVALKNSNEEYIGTNKDSLSITVRSQNVLQEKIFSFNITELQKGHYNVSFIIKRSGCYSFSVLVGGKDIHEFPRKITCLPYLETAVTPGYGPKIKSLQNLSSTCYFNSVLQVFNQTPGLITMLASMIEAKREYKLINSSNGDERSVTLSNKTGKLLTTVIKFVKQVRSEDITSQIIIPDYILNQLIESSKQQRFGQFTQEDSHELLRYLLYELKKEEIDFIKEQVYDWFGISSDPLTQVHVPSDMKDTLKNFMRAASKVNTPIDKVFSGEKLNVVICRECFEPSHTLEPFFDISLGIPDDAQDTASGGWQYQNKKYFRASKHDGKSLGGRNQELYGSDFSFNEDDLQKILKKKGLPYQATLKKKPTGATHVEISLADHTGIDNMDEDNKFICKSCSEKDPSGKIKLCLVTKQILIHRLPSALILHFKRFNIGDYNVTKNSKHVIFPHLLNMAPYCSTICLTEFGDANNDIFYGLYGVIVHMGSTLQSGHYIAYIRRRPDRQQVHINSAEEWEYDCAAAEDGMWFRTSDLSVSECFQGFKDIKTSEAYMLFYELLPRKVLPSTQV